MATSTWCGIGDLLSYSEIKGRYLVWQIGEKPASLLNVNISLQVSSVIPSTVLFTRRMYIGTYKQRDALSSLNYIY